MTGRSYSPSPPRGYGRRGRSPSPRGRYPGRGRDAATSLLVRNLRHDCRQEDLRGPFGQFGPLKDIYLPRDYYTGEPRGFGFIQYVVPEDAVEAKYQMDGQILLGRQLTVVFAEENRKKPTEMRSREGTSGRYYDRKRSSRYSQSSRYSRSPPLSHSKSQSRSHDYYSPPAKRGYSRSVSPQERRYSHEKSYPQRSRERSYSHSPPRAVSPLYNCARHRSQSPVRDHSPPYNGSKGHGQSPGRDHSQAYKGSRNRSPTPTAERSPVRGQSRSLSPSRSRSRSAGPPDYDR